MYLRPKNPRLKSQRPHWRPRRVTADEVLGQIVRVLSVSPQHSKMSLADMRLRVVPPLRLGYCRVLRGDDGHPLAYAAWARVSDEVHARLEAGNHHLRPDDWNSGS